MVQRIVPATAYAAKYAGPFTSKLAFLLFNKGSLGVTTVKGTAIVASDCGHLAHNFKEDHPSSLIIDLVAWLEAYDKLRVRATSVDLLFPGHDARMFTNYPTVAEDLTRLV